MTLGVTYVLSLGPRNFFRCRTFSLKRGRSQLSWGVWPACVTVTCRKACGALQWLLPPGNAFQGQGVVDSEVEGRDPSDH